MSYSRPAHRLPRQGPGEATSPRQWREFHRAVRRHAAVVEGLERRGQSKTEWHCVVAFNRLGESIPDTLHKGEHVLVDGQLVSSKYERENGKSKKAKAAKFAISWSVRANSVRLRRRAEAEAPAATPSPESPSDDAPL